MATVECLITTIVGATCAADLTYLELAQLLERACEPDGDGPVADAARACAEARDVLSRLLAAQLRMTNAVTAATQAGTQFGAAPALAVALAGHGFTAAEIAGRRVFLRPSRVPAMASGAVDLVGTYDDGAAPAGLDVPCDVALVTFAGRAGAAAWLAAADDPRAQPLLRLAFASARALVAALDRGAR